MVKSLQAAVLGKAGRQTSPHIDAAVSPQQQFWEMAAVCTVATIYTSPVIAFIISYGGRFDPRASLLPLIFLPRALARPLLFPFLHAR